MREMKLFGPLSAWRLWLSGYRYSDLTGAWWRESVGIYRYKDGWAVFRFRPYRELTAKTLGRAIRYGAKA